MTVSERIALCRLLSKMEEQKEFCAEIGIKDVSDVNEEKEREEKI